MAGTARREVYLDNASTTPVLPEVAEEMYPFLKERYGNPSSIHSKGREAADAVEEARQRISRLIGADASEVVFTSGGTEADNLAIKGVALAQRKGGRHVITTRIEHHAVLEPCKFLESVGFDVTYLPVDKYGTVDPGSVEEAIREDTVLVSVMHANNEVGTVEPIREIGKITREKGVLFHTDAVQSFGHLAIDVDQMGVDLVSASSHKLYGPKGVGALYVSKEVSLIPLIHGGGQERGLRASTENVPGIVGFGKAAEIAMREMEKRERRILRLRRRLCRLILDRIEDAYLVGHPTRRLPGNLNLVVRYVEGESMVLGLERYGVFASTGSACSSRDHGPSHVLDALGVPRQDIHSSIRFSIGVQNTREEIDYAYRSFEETVQELRKLSPLYRSIRSSKVS